MKHVLKYTINKFQTIIKTINSFKFKKKKRLEIHLYFYRFNDFSVKNSFGLYMYTLNYKHLFILQPQKHRFIAMKRAIIREYLRGAIGEQLKIIAFVRFIFKFGRRK